MNLFSETQSPQLPFYLPNNINYSYKYDEKSKSFFITIPNGELIYFEFFFNKNISDKIILYFKKNNTINWQSQKIKIYGKEVIQPRLTSWYGDTGVTYSYSGITLYPNKWNKKLLYIKKQIEKITDKTFNSVLLNWYRDGEDYMNWHADDEKELGTNPVIASISFGKTRDFVLRQNNDSSQKITIPLTHGSLLIMQGEIQHHWKHCLPKRKRVKGSRFNLTFRDVVDV
ncbi:MAG: Alkylated DNA repair protein AlkB [uncultured Campylobacterales bacterium]|uniref:Alkylated DNA repair protein AlkB n=1 Tax=uncultured Campylobacterales bacterium TaxID=352960 RepID=A0A6S6S8X7_9BACT|nr:MAG: Alkylated DNA repair protein AlkB [uncultured Campylobacterales bacterium]